MIDEHEPGERDLVAEARAARLKAREEKVKCPKCGDSIVARLMKPHQARPSCAHASKEREIRKEMEELGLAKCAGRGSIAYILAKKLGMESRDVVDFFEKPTYGRGRKTFGCYLPAWIVGLFDHDFAEACMRLGYITAKTRYEDHVELELIELLMPMARKAHVDMNVRAALEAACAIGGADAVVVLAGKEMP